MGQVFRYLAFVWDVEGAKRLVAERAPNATIPVKLLGEEMESGDGSEVGHVNRDHARTVDVTVPVIVASFDPILPLRPVVIDGWHRVWRAYTEDIDLLPAHLLSPAESLELLVVGKEILEREAAERRV